MAEQLHECDMDCITGMDIPTDPWTPRDIAYWTGTPRYQPWKDVAAFFRNAPERKYSDFADLAGCWNTLVEHARERHVAGEELHPGWLPGAIGNNKREENK